MIESLFSEDESINDLLCKSPCIERYFLIDYENVNKNGLNGILRLSENDCVRIYYSDNSQTLTFGLHRRIILSKANFEYTKVTLQIKNAADVQMLIEIREIFKTNKAAEYYIISNDTDFDKPIEQYQKLGIQVKRLGQISEYYNPIPIKSVVEPQKTDVSDIKSTKSIDKKEVQIRSIFEQKLNSKPYKEHKEEIINVLLCSDNKQSLNNELTRIISSSFIPELLKVYKEFISSLPSSSEKTTYKKLAKDKKKREEQFKSVYGQYFKNGIYKQKREEIISILVNSKTRQQINNELCKIIPGENVSKILKQLKPLLTSLPNK